MHRLRSASHVLALALPRSSSPARSPRRPPRRRRPCDRPSRRTSSPRSAPPSPRATSPAASRAERVSRQPGTTPEALEALSWLGRGALAAKQLDKAENYALETYDLCVEALKTGRWTPSRGCRLPSARPSKCGPTCTPSAARRADAVYLLQQELATYRATLDPRPHPKEHQPVVARRQGGARARAPSTSARRRRPGRAEGQARRAVLLGALVSGLQGHVEGGG